MKVLREFREFAVKGSVMDLAVGVIIGAAFGKIVTTLVNDIVMPPVSILLGGVDFRNRYWVLRGSVGGNGTLEDAKAAGATTVNYGQFLNVVLEFVIVAFAVFVLVKQVNLLRRRQAAKPAITETTRACPECLTEVPRPARRCKACTATLTPA